MPDHGASKNTLNPLWPWMIYHELSQLRSLILTRIMSNEPILREAAKRMPLSELHFNEQQNGS